jgi:transcriptional regulator with XRE-family HTH domain
MSLGALITKSRTDARLSIEDLAKATNIPVTLLRDMENDNFKKCGGETYARGHLRNIAAKLGIDERIFLDLFETEVTAPAKPIREMLNENNVTMPYQEPKRISWKVLAAGSAVVLILFAGVQFFFSNVDNGNEPEIFIATSATPSQEAVESVAPSPPASPEIAGGVNVELVASRGTTWLLATNENGEVLFSGQVRQGSSKSFSEATQVNLRVGNAGGVDISVNGKDVGSIGANREVVNLTYNAD